MARLAVVNLDAICDDLIYLLHAEEATLTGEELRHLAYLADLEKAATEEQIALVLGCVPGGSPRFRLGRVTT